MGDPKHTNNMAGYYLNGGQAPKRSRWRDALGALALVVLLMIIESLSWWWGLS